MVTALPPDLTEPVLTGIGFVRDWGAKQTKTEHLATAGDRQGLA